MGSLAETGFSIMQAVNSNTDRSVVIMVAKDVNEALRIADPVLAKESLRARALVRAHLKKLQKRNVYIVNSLEEMLNVSVRLYNVHKGLEAIREIISQGQEPVNKN